MSRAVPSVPSDDPLRDPITKAINTINRGRVRAARRVNRLKLFSEATTQSVPMDSDHPLIQVVLKLRDELESMPPPADCTLPQRNLRLNILRELTKATALITTEANKASAEAAHLRAAEMDRKLRIQEHADKMEILRAKGNKTFDVEALIKLANGEPGAEPEDNEPLVEKT